MAKNLFVSYSHRDELLRDQLEKHLKPLEHDGMIRSWHDRRIVAGTEFDTEIRSELEAADIILLLVSSDFISSEYCWGTEMKRAMERHDAQEARVIPVILRPADWQRSPFGRLLALPKDGKPVTSWENLDEAFVDVAKSLRNALFKEQKTAHLPDLSHPKLPEDCSENSLCDKSPEKATVQLSYRVPSFLNRSPKLSSDRKKSNVIKSGLNVFVDGTNVAFIHPNEIIHFNLSSGAHVIELRRLWHKSNILNLSALSGESILLICELVLLDSSASLISRALALYGLQDFVVLSRQ